MLFSSPLLFALCHFTGNRSLGSSQIALVSPLLLVPSYLTVSRPFTVSLPTLWHVPPLLRAIFSQSEQALSTSPMRKHVYIPRCSIDCAGISIYMCCCGITTTYF